MALVLKIVQVVAIDRETFPVLEAAFHLASTPCIIHAQEYRFYRIYLGYRLHIIHLRYILLEIGIAGRGFCLPPTGI